MLDCLRRWLYGYVASEEIFVPYLSSVSVCLSYIFSFSNLVLLFYKTNTGNIVYLPCALCYNILKKLFKCCLCQNLIHLLIHSLLLYLRSIVEAWQSCLNYSLWELHILLFKPWRYIFYFQVSNDRPRIRQGKYVRVSEFIAI